jgi:hypothetical protein
MSSCGAENRHRALGGVGVWPGGLVPYKTTYNLGICSMVSQALNRELVAQSQGSPHIEYVRSPRDKAIVIS